ncbi:MAG: nucleotidyltransferase family protein [Ferruginibacter sp.]
MGNDHLAGSYGIVLLAAGESARLGKPKQLLLYKGKCLLHHGVQVAIDTGTNPVIAVLGANADLVKEEIEVDKEVHIVVNKDWKEGMASSIRCGLEKLQEIAPGADAVIFMVCDQPFVTAKLLEDLVSKYQETGKPVIASKYENNSLGTPALFDKTIFAALMALKGDAGAKRIIKENPDWVNVVNFPLGNIDIDTDKDYEKLMSSQSIT